MTAHSFGGGDTVWLTDGSQAEYIAQVAGGAHLVHPIFEDDETGEPYVSSDISKVYEVHAKEPVAHFSEQVRARRDELANLEAKILEARRGLHLANSEHQRTMADLKRFEPFKQLELIMSGQVSHLIKREKSGELILVDVAKAERGDFSRDLAVCSVTFDATIQFDGQKVPRMHVRANRDRSIYEPVFFDGEEAAKAWVLAQIPRLIDGFRSERSSYGNVAYKAAGIVRTCKRFGYPVPQDIQTIEINESIANLSKRVAESEAQAASWRAQLDAARAQLPKEIAQ